MTNHSKKPKVLIFDIETTNLPASYGFMLCIGWQWLGEKAVHLKSVLDWPRSFAANCTNDKPLIRFATKLLRSADMLFGWYSTRFDLPFINSRAIKHGVGIVPRDIPHVDGWKQSKFGLMLRSNRLESVSEFLGTTHKTRLDPDSWIRAAAGHVPSIRYVLHHCHEDIVDTMTVYQRLRPLIIQHPNLSIVTGRPESCPTCGEHGTLAAQGWKIARTRKSRRFQCTKCGSWSLGPSVATGITVR